MSTSSVPTLRKLIIDTKTPAAEVTLINSNGQSIASGVSKLILDLPPALYKIRYRVGDRVVDQLVELSEDEPELNVAVPALPILSAAPLRDSGGGFNMIQELISTRHDDAGKHASIFVFLVADPD